ncbi:MAG: hypothetical protein WC343_02825 [Bacilli bacterium]
MSLQKISEKDFGVVVKTAKMSEHHTNKRMIKCGVKSSLPVNKTNVVNVILHVWQTSLKMAFKWLKNRYANIDIIRYNQGNKKRAL